MSFGDAGAVAWLLEGAASVYFAAAPRPKGYAVKFCALDFMVTFCKESAVPPVLSLPFLLAVPVLSGLKLRVD